MRIILLCDKCLRDKSGNACFNTLEKSYFANENTVQIVFIPCSKILVHHCGAKSARLKHAMCTPKLTDLHFQPRTFQSKLNFCDNITRYQWSEREESVLSVKEKIDRSNDK